MALSDDVEIWRKLKQSLKREQFAARFPHPLLVRRAPRAGGDTGAEKAVSFDTGVVDFDAVTAAAPGGLAGARVLALVKAEGNPYLDRISVGRAANCDVVVRDVSVSKLHAYFKVLGPAEAELVDARSANGTRVNGRKVDAGGAVRVTNGDTVIFGGVAVQFVDAKRLYELL